MTVTNQRNDSYFQEAVQAAKVGLWDWDLRTNSVRYSAEWKLQLGYAANEISSELSEWESRIHPDDLPKVRQRFAEYRRRPWPDFEQELRMQHKDCSWRWMLVRAKLVMDEKGEATRLVGCLLDITRHKLIEIELQETQRIARLGHWERDLATNKISWSGETYRIFGVPQTERQITFEDFLNLVHPADRPRVLDCVQDAVGKLRHYSIDYRIVRADGVERFVHSEAEVVRDNSGRPLHAFGTLQEITERKQSENALRESERKLRLVIDTIPAMAWIVQPTGAVSFMNQRWLEYSGLSLEEAIRLPTGTMHPEDIPKAIEKWSKAMAAGEPYEEEMRLRRADGEYRWFLVRTVPLRDERGNVIEWYGTSTDIEDRKRAEEALRETQALLARVARASIVGELTASIAHEVNQPLGGIVTNAEAALNWVSDERPNLKEARDALERIIRDGTRAAEVIARIRALLKNGKPNKTRFSLEPVIREIIALAKSEARLRQVSVQTRVGANLPEVSADRVQIQQVLMNLVMNSLDALSGVADGPRILRIQAEKENSKFVRVVVADTGTGIDPDSMKKIFEPFHTTKAHGLGLGLSISRSIVEAHGGRLRAIHNDGPGATFQFTLPIEWNNCE